jgi:hypothetical protein
MRECLRSPIPKMREPPMNQDFRLKLPNLSFRRMSFVATLALAFAYLSLLASAQTVTGTLQGARYRR